MRQTLTPKEWFDEYIDIDKLQSSILECMADAIHNENVEDGVYIALVQDIISSGHGSYIPSLALEYFEYEDVQHDLQDYDYQEEVYSELDDFTNELSEIIMNKLEINARVYFGYWDADGTYCMIALMNEEDIEELL